MKYLPLLGLEILHDYYADRRCLDFEVEPTTHTQKLLDDYRCTLKRFSNGLRIAIAARDENTTFIPLPKKLIFTFHLRLRNPDFTLFTDLTEVSRLAAAVFTNKLPAASGELIPVSREARSTEQFTVQEPSTKEALVLSGQPFVKLKASEAFVVRGLARKSAYKEYDEAAKTITVNSSGTEPGTDFTITYPVLPPPPRGIFAEVEIQYGPTRGCKLGDASPFRITFQSRKARWKYYIVTDKSNSHSGQPALEDRDKVLSFRLERLTPPLDPEDKIAGRLAKQYPDRQYFRFVSSTLIPCQQAARKNLQFRLNGERVMDSLPNPSLHHYCIEVRDAVPEYSLYQVIQYFTQSYS